MTGEKKMNLGATTVLFSIRRKEKRGAAIIFAQKRPRLKWTKWYLFSRDYAFFIFHFYIEHILVFDITGIMREVILLPHKKLKENVKKHASL